ncbi:MAG: TlpA family protein disulfide reductase [Fibrobacterota bacterium]|nr:TlpA family protein disulfide reductase [Fibrobacterota bacterium]
MTSSHLGAVLLAFVASALLLSGCQENRPISGKVPTISLKSHSGETYTLAGEDKVVTLLVFWATWCQPCLMEMPALVKLHGKYRDRNFRVVSINVDDPEGQKVKSISREYGINYPVLIGNEDVMKQFGGVTALPTSFLIDRDGRIREKLQGLHPEEELERMVVTALDPAK